MMRNIDEMIVQKTQSNLIINILEKITILMAKSDEPDAQYYCDFLVYTLAQLNKPHILKKIAENILKAYGGMAAFSDVTLYKDGEPLMQEQPEFSDLRDELYLACKDVVN